MESETSDQPERAESGALVDDLNYFKSTGRKYRARPLAADELPQLQGEARNRYGVAVRKQLGRAVSFAVVPLREGVDPASLGDYDDQAASAAFDLLPAGKMYGGKLPGVDPEKHSARDAGDACDREALALARREVAAADRDSGKHRSRLHRAAQGRTGVPRR